MRATIKTVDAANRLQATLEYYEKASESAKARGDDIVTQYYSGCANGVRAAMLALGSLVGVDSLEINSLAVR